MLIHKPKFTMLTAIAAALSLSFFSLAPSVFADTVQMPNPSADNQTGNAPWNVPVPTRGMSKAEVEFSFGSPQAIEGPSGNPPIYYWEYAKFTVYFESDYVIHTVRKYKPQ